MSENEDDEILGNAAKRARDVQSLVQEAEMWKRKYYAASENTEQTKPLRHEANMWKEKYYIVTNGRNECPLCNKYMCDKCIVNCEECQTNVCDECDSFCRFDGEPKCYTRICNKCCDPGNDIDYTKRRCLVHRNLVAEKEAYEKRFC